MASHLSLEVDQGYQHDKDSIIRTGTTLTCIAHIIAAVIGSGVLSLAWSTAQLGWIAAPICMLFFGIVTYISAYLMSECYRTSMGERNRSYMEAVRFYLGRRQTWFCGWLQYLSFFGAGVVYTFTTASCIRAVQKSNCYHKEGHTASCSYGDSFYMILFGALEMVLCLIPDFNEMAWLSTVAAIMSFAYSSIGFCLGLAKIIGNRRIKGRIGGIAMPSSAEKVWRISQALGDIAFSYPYTAILLEIQDTLKSPPPEDQTMKRASLVSVFTITFFYLCCGCFGYAALGDETPGNILTGFGFYEPYWLIDLANICVVIHLIGGYQVFSQPLFSFIDGWCAKKFPNSRFVTKFYTVKMPLLAPYKLNLLRICFRSIYVIITTGLAMFFPYFNQVLGLLGSFSFWPIAVYFPVKMYFVQRNIAAWTNTWILLQVFSIVCLMLSIFAFVGSVEGVRNAKLS